VTILIFIVVAAAASTLGLITRRSPAASGTIGLLGLLVAAIVATTIRADDLVTIGQTVLTGSSFARLYLVVGAISGFMVIVIALAAGRAGDLPAATLGMLAVAGVVLASRDIFVGAVAATIGGLLGVAITLVFTTVRSVALAARELRALVVAGLLGVGAFAWAARFPDTTGAEPALLGIAYLCGVAAVAIRLGAIPFHLWVARVADAVPDTALPLVMAWGPAAFVIVGLTWIDGSIAVTGGELVVERAIIVLIALLTVVLGSVAALVHEDLGHVVGYGIIADAGFLVLSLAALDPPASASARAYLIVYVVAKTAFAAWAAASRVAFDARRVDELGGWARRAPILALGLLGVLVAGVGLPGVAIWESRAQVAEAVLGYPLALAFVLAGLTPVLYVGRLFVVGYGRTSPAVAAGSYPWPRLPQRGRPRDLEAASSWVRAAWRDNRAPIATLSVALLAGLAAIVAAGGFGVREAADTFGSVVATP
jgi:formate hydrogenlyase subunit 3/multisubunit Na+/H+ antiporter MnhD subunit